MPFDADVIVIGSGFGGSVAALRLCEAGQKVLLLERGDWVERESFEADLDALWQPHRDRFGMNDLRPRGRTVIPWVGAAVGGGSHVYAGTMKRMASFERFPQAIANDDMGRYYDRAAELIEPTPFPDYPPYSDIRSTQLLYDVGRKLAVDHPDLIEDYGPIDLAISFAPPDGEQGASFINKHGAQQRYADTREQALLGGDIGAKNSLDRNYLHLAQQAGLEIRALCKADRIEPLDGGGYRVSFKRWIPETSRLKRFVRKWFGRWAGDTREGGQLTAQRVVIAAGCVGSTELLLRNKEVHQTLPDLSPRLGERYTTNGDFISAIFPFRGLFVSWLGFAAVIAGLVMQQWLLAAGGGVAYALGLLISRRPYDPDLGSTNSDYIRFRGADGESQGAYVESGRYPTPVRFGIAVLLSALGLWRPRTYGRIILVTRWLRRLVPPFAMLARTWPIPLLKMGRDAAFGRFRLDSRGRAVIDYEVKRNREFYRYLNRLGRMIARAAGAWWTPNFAFWLSGRLEVPHNQGGVPMGDGPDEGVVDHAGRVYGYRDLVVLDGSIIPISPGPNPAFTILALAERAMDHIVGQLERGAPIAPG